MDRQRRSGLGAAAFCRSQGMAVTTFHKWKQRLAKGKVAARFVEVKQRAEAEPAWLMELELPHGVVLRFRGHAYFDTRQYGHILWMTLVVMGLAVQPDGVPSRMRQAPEALSTSDDSAWRGHETGPAEAEDRQVNFGCA